ncbi:MAG: IS66 family insertion sequence element accessory protein TnpB, partial [Ileibacterium sp.]|nr:IS66 family insertion sequence element accessory protein TnpB [Ileibacterium sp.]
KSLFIFSNKRHNRLKCLYFNGCSFWVFIKRVEKKRQFRLSNLVFPVKSSLIPDPYI